MTNTNYDNIMKLAESIHTLIFNTVSEETCRQNIIELPKTFTRISFTDASVPDMTIEAFPTEADICNWLCRCQNELIDHYSETDWDKFKLTINVSCYLYYDECSIFAGIALEERLFPSRKLPA